MKVKWMIKRFLVMYKFNKITYNFVKEKIIITINTWHFLWKLELNSNLLYLAHF